MLKDVCFSTCMVSFHRRIPHNKIQHDKPFKTPFLVAMTDTAKPRKVVFVFPGAAGHVNPSLPVCRRFIELGWEVPRSRHLGHLVGGIIPELGYVAKKNMVNDPTYRSFMIN